jgi:hypothetical protein
VEHGLQCAMTAEEIGHDLVMNSLFALLALDRWP